MALLPDVTNLPSGFAIIREEISPSLAALSPISQEQSENDEIRDLEATIAALEEQVAESDIAPTNPSSTSSSNEPLDILSITNKDAGIGDGSLYVYVEVKNQSGRLYSYVGLEGTCRNQTGGIVGTGYGNTANVPNGSTVVITMIFLSVLGCTDIQVRFDALTSLQ